MNNAHLSLTQSTFESNRWNTLLIDTYSAAIELDNANISDFEMPLLSAETAEVYFDNSNFFEIYREKWEHNGCVFCSTTENALSIDNSNAFDISGV